MAKQPELDDFRVPYFDDGKKSGKFSLDEFRSGREAFFDAARKMPTARVCRRSARNSTRCRSACTRSASGALLLVLQGMDTSGKDGTIRAVFHEVDPLGLRIVPFKAPTPVELAHDFLWRVHAQAPAAGELTIFNRSHYEDLLVPTVLGKLDADAFEQRCRHIREFEALLADSGTTIIKCMLHISKDEQRAASAGAHRRSDEALEIRRRPISKHASSGTSIRRPIATRWP